ncbi:MAG: lipid A-modifier LpxR family protein [Bacteroidota bacterium]|nr:lipid A-modifier LpxR family protein [Bacteroidota bacterium]
MKIVKIGIALWLFMTPFLLKAQQDAAYKYEVLAGHDNDFTIFGTRTDWHYTYGIHLGFGWRPKQTNFITQLLPNKKAFSHYIAAHIQAYTPDYARTYQIVKTRQPYAGWGYVDFANNYGFENAFLQLKVDLGILGPAVHAGDIQNFIHQKFSKDIFIEKWLNLYSLSRISAGNIFTFFEQGLYFRLGQFNAIGRSVARQQSLLGNGETEIFLEAGFNMNFSAFNATIENANAQGEKVVPQNLVNHSILNGHVGVFFSQKRYAIGLKWNYTEGEIKGNEPHRFAILAGTYKFN